MSPQFVDYDGDGDLDVLAATFDGSPHVALLGENGYATPKHIMARDGQRIVMNQFWNDEASKWDETDRCNPGGSGLRGHLTSAWAVDYDGDGDLDLLLGDHEHGQVLLRVNEGKVGAPAFATANRVVLCDGKPMLVPGTVATLRTVDWNGDGAFDLLVGSMGEPYKGNPRGQVLLYRNRGSASQPEFGAPEVLIEPAASSEMAQGVSVGIHMDCADLDGDGDLDLIAGGYSMWRAKQPERTAAQTERLAVIDAELAALQSRFDALNRELQDQPKPADAPKARGGQAKIRQELAKQRVALQKERDGLDPPQQRQAMTWYYENLAVRQE